MCDAAGMNILLSGVFVCVCVFFLLLKIIAVCTAIFDTICVLRSVGIRGGKFEYIKVVIAMFGSQIQSDGFVEKCFIRARSQTINKVFKAPFIYMDFVARNQQ